MNASSQKDPIAPPSEQINNKCALKLLGIDFGDVTDEAILEFISNYVEPSSIKALFYDFFNCFYVLHLSDIESTGNLIGKTLLIGTHHISFLPLVDCFVIANVYLSLSNKELREIFSVFGNVCKVENCHVLPNSSKFFHVLSGTREISFFLPGLDSEVQIPVTVVHSPYAFHVKHKCLGCLKQGHSLMNCPVRVEDETPLSEFGKYDSPKKNDEKDVVIKIMQVQEMTFEVSNEEGMKVSNVEGMKVSNVEGMKVSNVEGMKVSNQEGMKVSNQEIADEKLAENVSSDATTIKMEALEEKEESSKKILQKKLRGNPLGVKKGKGKMKARMVTFNRNRRLKRILAARKKNNSPSDNSEPDFEHASNLPKIFSLDLPSTVQSCIMKSEGVIPTNALVELMYIDARSRGNILDFVLQHTSNIPAVLAQLRKLQRDLLLKVEVLNTYEYKFRQKVWSIIRVLKKISTWLIFCKLFCNI